MTNPPGTTPKRNDKLPQEILDLVVAVGKLPQPQRHILDPVLQKVIEGTGRRKRILGLVQEALSQLRLDMKYLMFDLEATRRERDALRDELEDGQVD
jgi:hypothetical protein